MDKSSCDCICEAKLFGFGSTKCKHNFVFGGAKNSNMTPPNVDNPKI